MKRLVLWSVALMMAMTIIAPAAVPASAAQQQVVLNPGGHALAWSGAWTADPAFTTTSAGYSTALFSNPVGYAFATIVYDPGLIPARELITSFVGGFSETLFGYTVVDAGSYQNVTYELGTGDGLTLFALFLDGGLGAQSVGYFVVAPSATFADAVALIQLDFALDGGRVLTGVDGLGLQAQALGLAPPAPTTTFVPLNPAQATQIVSAGTTNISVFGGWQYDAMNSVPEQATFSLLDTFNQTVRLLSYGEFYDSTVANPAQAMDTFSQAFFQGAGAVNVRETGTGFLIDGALWRMYSFDLSGTQVAYFITVGQRADGAFVITTLTTNTSVMAQTISQAQNAFLLNGSGRVFERVVIADVTFGLPVGVQGQSAPPAGQTFRVGTSQLTVGGRWEYDAAGSMTDQATFSILDGTSQSMKLASYGEFRDFRVANIDQATDTFTDAFFQGAGVSRGEMNGSGTLVDGTLWRMYTFTLSGTQVSMLITVSQRVDATWVISTLTAITPLMEQAIVQVQTDFRVNGSTSVFSGIDAAAVTWNLSGPGTSALAA